MPGLKEESDDVKRKSRLMRLFTCSLIWLVGNPQWPQSWHSDICATSIFKLSPTTTIAYSFLFILDHASLAEQARASFAFIQNGHGRNPHRRLRRWSSQPGSQRLLD